MNFCTTKTLANQVASGGSMPHDPLAPDVNYPYDGWAFYCPTNYGCWYNWYTATASYGTTSTTDGTDVEYNICPKNWTLPNSGHLKTGVIPMMLATGFYWSRTNTTTSVAKSMQITSNTYVGNSNNGKYYAFSARCLAK